MNKIKRLYVSLFLTVLTVIAGYALWQTYEHGLDIGWIGVLLASLPLLLMLGRAFVLTNLARTSDRLVAFTGLGAVGILFSAYAAFSQNAIEPLSLALIAFIGFQLYNYWYSDLSREESALLAEGQALPEFTVYESDGTAFSSSQLKGSPALILFYRGNWCPLCMAQIKEIAAEYKRMADKGIEVLLISPQPETHTKSLADKFDVPFKFLVDKNNQVAQQLNIAMEDGLPFGLEALGYDGDTVFPTAIATDAQNKIIYSDQTSNYRVRPEPEDYMKVYEANGI